MNAHHREGGTTQAERNATTELWPALPLEAWKDTYETVHMWTQIVGKTRLKLAPMINHWWQATYLVTSRGLCTTPIPYGERTFEVDFDFIDHVLSVRTSDGPSRTMPLVPRAVADFYREYRAMLDALGIHVRIWPKPAEVQNPIPFPEDRVHASYDGDAVHRCWKILVQSDRVLKAFRGRFLGKASPSHFFWGSFDLACTRFSGRPAPPHPGGVPGLPDWVTREAYSHECASAGFWPGGGPVPEPTFYAYSYPEPAGYSEAKVGPRETYYHPEMHEFFLPYRAVLSAPDPDAMLMEFLQSTYEAAADLAKWDRAALERR